MSWFRKPITRSEVIADILGLRPYGEAGIDGYNPEDSLYWEKLKPLIEELIDEKLKDKKT